VIVPVPPSRKRAYQPVIEIAKAIATRLPKPVGEVAVNKVKETPELKDVYDYEQRIKLLDGAFEVDAGAVQSKQILLVDDLYRSGATATLVAKALLGAGAKPVYMLAMTKTRTRT
jgi:competence protein ComFC